jgi:predicted enzyme related to lactoylglutathione lyase
MAPRIALVEFPADDAERARRFWGEFLGVALSPRTVGEGWEAGDSGAAVGVHQRGLGPGDSFSLPYFRTENLAQTLEHVRELGGTVVHPGEMFAVCRDSEGNPFGLASAGS